MYKTIDMKESNYDFEKKIREYWEENDIANLSIEEKQGCEKFIFFEGPPTANGKPGIHHVISRAIKDMVCRYKTMKGFQVHRKAGWDTHGLPVEIEVEKRLGLKDKAGIEKFGVEEFCKKCKESVFEYEKEWREMTKIMGYWIDLDNPYKTLNNEYIESVWWILNQFWKKDLLYKGYKIVPYCPSCGTPLSSHEVAQGYKEVEDPSVFVKFKVCDAENTFFLAWTTTPWTLISNVALAVNSKEKYVKIKTGAEYLILAEPCLPVIEEDYEIVDRFSGKDLLQKDYEQLFPFIKPDKRAFYVVEADYVTTEDGTGIVHTAPAFGQDDYNTGMNYDLPIIQPVDESGNFIEEITDFKGLFVKEADKLIIRNLKDRGLLYQRKQIMHSYPFCWRCDSPLLYYARDTWYIKTSLFKDAMLKANSEVNWYPGFVGEKRFGEWLINNVDWALSRNRFWGTPLNVWLCDECGSTESVGSIQELREKGKMGDGRSVPEDIELHRPYIDNVFLKCQKCSSRMTRTKEVIDCWFDSGSMPFSQWHYPFENYEKFEEDLFPADFICEGIDQTRGWFYTLLAISTILKGKSPFKNVLVNDLILDKKGQKMSKSKGNTVDPMELMNSYGADAIRWYLLAVSPPWVPTKFDTKGVEDVVNKFIGTLKNTYSFFTTYANIDNFRVDEHKLSFSKTNQLDKWIISRLNSVIKKINSFNDNYDFTRSLRMLHDFILDDVSNWYVRRSRRRYWEMSLTEDKKEAYITLYQVLVEYCKLIAPFAPYVAEGIFVNLTGKKSVHLEDYPSSNQNFIFQELEEEMSKIIDLVSLGRAARNTTQIKVRQTLQALYVPAKYEVIVNRMQELIKEEINVKEILFINEKDNFVEYDVKLNFKVIGPKYGKHVKDINFALQNTDSNRIIKCLHKGEPFYLEAVGSTFKLLEEDLIISIKDKEGFCFESNKDMFVALDTRLTDELIDEGLARELVNKIQYSRKENRFEVMDRINVYFNSDQRIQKVFNDYGEYIKSETLTEGIFCEPIQQPDMKLWDINGIKVYLTINKVYN